MNDEQPAEFRIELRHGEDVLSRTVTHARTPAEALKRFTILGFVPEGAAVHVYRGGDTQPTLRVAIDTTAGQPPPLPESFRLML